MGGRMEKHLKVAYDTKEQPLLPPGHPYSRLLLAEVHAIDHGGIDAMLMRARPHGWVVRGKTTARAVKQNCFVCIRLAKETMEQIMAPVPDHRVGPTPPFLSTAVDLFGPFEIFGTINKRKTAKVWGVIFVCTTTTLTHVELMESYSTDQFLLALRRFMALRGAPARFQSDQGTQLIAAAKMVPNWDWSKVHRLVGESSCEWHAVPTQGQHYNGLAERLIGMLKKALKPVLESTKFTMAEMNTVMTEATYKVNSRPLARPTSDDNFGNIITPLHLQLGRATIAIPDMRFDQRADLSKRVKFVNNALAEFWDKYQHQVLAGRALSYKWRKENRNLKVGDVVEMIDQTSDTGWHCARVHEVKVGTDGRVRSATLMYKLPTEERFRTTDRPITRISLLVPVDYTNEEQIEPAEANASASASVPRELRAPAEVRAPEDSRKRVNFQMPRKTVLARKTWVPASSRMPRNAGRSQVGYPRDVA